MSEETIAFLRLRRWTGYAVINLLIVAAFGAALRYKAVFYLPGVDYKYLLNAHSHFAFSGWITTAIFIGLLYMLDQSGVRLSPMYRCLFWLNQLSSFGMLVSFACQGYGTVSIIFSALSVLFAYGFAIRYTYDIKRTLLPIIVKHCTRLALVFSVLSSAGPFLLAYSMSHAIGNMNFYFNAIYLYLHFQYNGWFTFGIFALVLWKIPKIPSAFIGLMGLACIPAYCLSLLWTDPSGWVWLISGTAAIIQAIALAVLIRFIYKNYRLLSKQMATMPKILAILSLLAFIIKISLQALSVLPPLGNFAFSHRPVVIAYLHLVVLAFVTFMLLAFFLQQKLVTHRQDLKGKTGLVVFVGGVVVNEVLLLIQSMRQYYAHPSPSIGYYLFGAAMLMLVGAGMIAKAQFTVALSPSPITNWRFPKNDPPDAHTKDRGSVV